MGIRLQGYLTRRLLPAAIRYSKHAAILDLEIVSFVRISQLNWIAHVYRMDSNRKISQVFNNNPQGSRPRRRPKNRRWNCVQTDTNKYNTINLERGVKNRAGWEKCVKDGKVRIGVKKKKKKKKKKGK